MGYVPGWADVGMVVAFGGALTLTALAAGWWAGRRRGARRRQKEEAGRQ